MLFSLVHNPCSTTIYTIWKETRSVKWTALSTLMPFVPGFGVGLRQLQRLERLLVYR